MTASNMTMAFGSIRDHFKPLDYFIFAGMLMISASIGIYYACKDVHKSYEEFIMGGRRLHYVPVGISITASFVSSITMLGTPAEIYRYGLQFSLMAVSYTLMMVIYAHIFMPIYHRLQFTSIYEASRRGAEESLLRELVRARGPSLLGHSRHGEPNGGAGSPSPRCQQGLKSVF